MIVFLVEEKSMHAALQGLLPKLFPQWREKVDWLCVPHEGKQDLEKSIPRKLIAWQSPEDRFVILRDQDSADCGQVKRHLVTLCGEAGRPDTLVRIPCRELEAWFLGDLRAVEQGMGVGGLAHHQERAKFRDPDALGNAHQELSRLTGIFTKIQPARKIAKGG